MTLVKYNITVRRIFLTRLFLYAIIRPVKITHFKQSNNHASWLNKPVNSGALRHYLIGNGSLTRRLQAQSKQFLVKPVLLRQAKVPLDEAALLGLPPQQNALLREVLLVCNSLPVVFAHSVLPRLSLRGKWRGLRRLGNQPLGATLFANPKVQRTALTYKKLNRGHRLYKRIMQLSNTNAMLSSLDRFPVLWARRSVFSLKQSGMARAQILVTEVFLPAVLNLPTHL